MVKNIFLSFNTPLGIRKRMLTDFFWEQMLGEVIEELAMSQNPGTSYCTEHNANFVKENFEPRNLAVSADENVRTNFYS